MRTFWKALCLLLLINALALVGGLAWLKATGRLDRARAARVRDIFRLTIADEKAHEAASAQEAQVNHQKSVQAARLASVAIHGAVTIAQRLESERQGDEIAMQRVERLQRDIASLQQQLVLAKNLLAKQKADLEADRKAFEETRARQLKIQNDTDFQQAVQMYEQLPPKQAKDMFQQLITEGKKDQVIDYLAAMSLRKATSVLKAFKTVEETIVATDLVQRLRERGIDPEMSNPSPQGPT
jgi:hypothetical protein